MTRFTHAIGTLSWIDPKAGLPEFDKGGDPGLMLSRQRFFDRQLYRFSNFLEAWIDVEGGRKIVNAGFSSDSGMYMAPSFLDTIPVPIGKIGQEIYRNPPFHATFRQIVGCRTEAPEKIGSAVGAYAGMIVAGPLMGPLIGPYVGYKAGRKTAGVIMGFPPIWTALELIIHVDGTFEHKLKCHSLFPSVSYYAEGKAGHQMFTRQGFSYDGVPNLAKWQEKGWGPSSRGGSGPVEGNPWSMTKPSVGHSSSAHAIPTEY